MQLTLFVSVCAQPHVPKREISANELLAVLLRHKGASHPQVADAGVRLLSHLCVDPRAVGHSTAGATLPVDSRVVALAACRVVRVVQNIDPKDCVVKEGRLPDEAVVVQLTAPVIHHSAATYCKT
jgi:hypothetical protein